MVFKKYIASFLKPMVICIICATPCFSAQLVQKLINEQAGQLKCGGGTGPAWLYTGFCQKVTIERHIFGSALYYHITCVDRNNKDHLMSCQSYHFEYDKKQRKQENFWDKSNKQKVQ